MVTRKWPPRKKGENLPLLGSWTDFRRAVSSNEQEKLVIAYLPIISQPPKYDVCKYYLNDLNKIIADLELSHVFVHADEEVYARLLHTTWIFILILIGGFHQLRVRKKNAA